MRLSNDQRHLSAARVPSRPVSDADTPIMEQNHFSAALDTDIRVMVVCRRAFGGFSESFNYYFDSSLFGGKSGELGRINVDTRRL